MKASDLLIEKIKELEGLRLRSYRCPAGVWTIGYGHTGGVKRGQVIGELQAEVLLKGDLLPVENYLNGLGLRLGQGRFDALADFAFNLGIGALSKSTLLKKVRIDMEDKTIPDEFARWVHAGGKVVPGLVKRRNWEAKRWAEQ